MASGSALGQIPEGRENMLSFVYVSMVLGGTKPFSACTQKPCLQLYLCPCLEHSHMQEGEQEKGRVKGSSRSSHFS